MCWRICGGNSSKGPTAMDLRFRTLISCSVADLIIGGRWLGGCCCCGGPGWGCKFWGAPNPKCLPPPPPGGVPWRPWFCWWWCSKCLGGGGWSQDGSRKSIMLFCLAGMPLEGWPWWGKTPGGTPPGPPPPPIKGSMTSTFILFEALRSNFVLDRPLEDDSRLLFPSLLLLLGRGWPAAPRPPESVVGLKM